MPADALIVIAIQNFFTSSTTGELVAVFLARFWIFAFVPFLAWLWVYGTKKDQHAVKEALWSAGLAILIAELLALTFLRFRPFLAFQQILVLIPPPLTSSFPSIHTAISSAITSALYLADRRLGLLGLLIVLGVAIGRMAAGVHFPTDILGGLFVGMASFIIVRLGHKALRKKQS